MDSESLLLECGALSLEICLTYLVYRLYKTNAQCLKYLKEAECLEIDGELENKVGKSGGIISYAVLSGNIKALTPPLRSQYLPYLNGVIREKVTQEHKVRWSPFLRIWTSANHSLQHTTHSVPFALCNKSTGFFKKQMAVEVVEPLLGQELMLPSIYDEFTPHSDTFGDTVFGFFQGERTIGLQEIEKMLCENDCLTVIGKLILENSKLKIKPPENGATYYVTPLSIENVIERQSTSTKLLKVTTILMSTVTFFLGIYVLRHLFSEIKKKVFRDRELKRLEEQRRQRRMADLTRKEQNENIPKCVVCLEIPVEILILECGHACLCYSCSEKITRICPVCREPIERIVPAFWP